MRNETITIVQQAMQQKGAHIPSEQSFGGKRPWLCKR